MTREFSMRLLFIKPKHIGDTLLLMPTLIAVRQAYPAAEIWLLVRRGCESILAGRREIDRLLLLAGETRPRCDNPSPPDDWSASRRSTRR
jgi:heptosyltransferase-3